MEGQRGMRWFVAEASDGEVLLALGSRVVDRGKFAGLTLDEVAARWDETTPPSIELYEFSEQAHAVAVVTGNPIAGVSWTELRRIGLFGEVGVAGGNGMSWIEVVYQDESNRQDVKRWGL